MKKIFKGLAVLAATAAVGTGLAFATGCGGKDGKYVGSYSYENYGHTYGIVVQVTVKNNIITRVEDITKSNEDTKDWVSISSAGYGWEEEDVKNWNTNEEWLLAQYEGLSVADVLAIDAYVKTNGEPYSIDKNGALVTDDYELVISGATQGSVRVLLAVQDALGKTTEYGRVHSGN